MPTATYLVFTNCTDPARDEELRLAFHKGAAAPLMEPSVSDSGYEIPLPLPPCRDVVT